MSGLEPVEFLKSNSNAGYSPHLTISQSDFEKSSTVQTKRHVKSMSEFFNSFHHFEVRTPRGLKLGYPRISPYIFLGDSKLRANSSTVKIVSAGERTHESNCLSPRTKAPRAQGRARRPIRTHGGRTYVRSTARKLI